MTVFPNISGVKALEQNKSFDSGTSFFFSTGFNECDGILDAQCMDLNALSIFYASLMGIFCSLIHRIECIPYRHQMT
jgi:hypothetical protein